MAIKDQVFIVNWNTDASSLLKPRQLTSVFKIKNDSVLTWTFKLLAFLSYYQYIYRQMN